MQCWQYGKGLICLRPIFKVTLFRLFLVASLTLSFVLIPISSNAWHQHLYIRDPARKNQSVLFTRRADLCIQGFLLKLSCM